jgi:hypothetical protein
MTSVSLASKGKTMNTFDPGASVLIAISGIADASGQPTAFQNPPSWTSSDPTILPLTVQVGGLSATGTSLKAGTVTISATGDGVTKTIVGTFAAGVVATFVLTMTQLAPPPPPPANP